MVNGRSPRRRHAQTRASALELFVDIGAGRTISLLSRIKHLYVARPTCMFTRYCTYGMSLQPSGAAKAGSPDCLAWPRGTAKARGVRLGERLGLGRG